MKSLLAVTALLEGLTGLALIAVPSVVVSLLLGASLTEPSGMMVGRVGGAALLSLAIACWRSRNNVESSKVMIKPLVLYNILTTSLLVYGALVETFSGIGLWPAALLHVGLLVWCFRYLRK